MATKRKTPPKRDKDNATLTISLPKALKEEIEKAARSDNRSTSNFVTTELSKLLKALGKLGLLAFIGLHCFKSPLNWSLAALKKTGQAGVAMIAKAL